MNPVKKIIIEETAKVLREMKKRKKTKDAASNLFEAIKTADVLKSNPKKHKIAKKLIAITESKFIKERQRLKEEHGREDESEMAKAQILAIVEKSKELYNMLQDGMQLEDWVQYKLSIAENYIDAVHGFMKYFNGVEDMDNEMQMDMEDEKEWDDVEEEEFDEEDEDYYDDEDFEDFEDFDVEDEFDEEDDEFDEEGI